LPLIDTIKLFSGENITKIKSVFSGTLSYLFNNFQLKMRRLARILKIDNGYTEPDQERIYAEMM
jgi:aspartokinase/homoserine dehydrogenase 1